MDAYKDDFSFFIVNAYKDVFLFFPHKMEVIINYLLKSFFFSFFYVALTYLLH